MAEHDAFWQPEPPRRLEIAPSRRQVLGGTVVGAAVLGGGVLDATPATAAASSRYPKGVRPTELYVIDRAELADDEAVLVATVQGLLARRDGGRRGPAIYLRLANGYATWLDELVNRYDIPAQTVDDPWDLVDRFRQPAGIAGYVLYRPGEPSVNVATTAAGVAGAVAVSEGLEADATARGLSLVADVRDRDDAWALRTYWPDVRHDLAVEQKTESAGGTPFTQQLRDYATMAGAFTFYDGNSALRQEVVDALDPDAVTLGWGDGSEGENVFVSMSSESGVATIPADWASNLSCLSGLTATRLRQRAPVWPRQPRPGRHYVSFLVTDGDNVQWMLNDLSTSPRWYASPQRGAFDLGWGVSPVMIDLAPTVLRWHYANASVGHHRDRFVVGPSGGGYLYPSQYPRADLESHTEQLAATMRRADLRVVQILDFESFEDTELWSTYLQHDQIAGLVYLEYSRYDRLQGRVVWANGKPVVSARSMLWEGLGPTEAELADQLNAAPRDPSSPDGYSVVMMHAWSKTLDDIRTVVDNLDPHVEVVTPDALVALMTRAVERS